MNTGDRACVHQLSVAGSNFRGPTVHDLLVVRCSTDCSRQSGWRPLILLAIPRHSRTRQKWKFPGRKVGSNIIPMSIQLPADGKTVVREQPACPGPNLVDLFDSYKCDHHIENNYSRPYVISVDLHKSYGRAIFAILVPHNNYPYADKCWINCKQRPWLAQHPWESVGLDVTYGRKNSECLYLLSGIGFLLEFGPEWSKVYRRARLTRLWAIRRLISAVMLALYSSGSPS